MTMNASIVWETRWQAVRPTAEYNHNWGIERIWRENADEWGYPLTDYEEVHDASGFKGRVFSKVGLVVWDPASGAQVIGWP